MPSQPKTDAEIVLGVDFGGVYTGVALGRSGYVAPLTIISKKEVSAVVTEIARIAVENKIKKIVVGLPVDEEGKETFESKEVRKFAKLLKTISKKQVVFQNEYGSSAESFKESLALGVSAGRRKHNDHLSAALILKRYFDES